MYIYDWESEHHYWKSLLWNTLRLHFIRNFQISIWGNVSVNAVCQILYFFLGQYVNSLWPSDAIWRERSGSTLAQVMACCLTAPRHYLNQCWIIADWTFKNKILLNFNQNTQVVFQKSAFETAVWELFCSGLSVLIIMCEHVCLKCVLVEEHFDSLVQDCSNSSALAMELLQSCNKPSIYKVLFILSGLYNT